MDPQWWLAWQPETEHREMVARMAEQFASGEVPWGPADVGFRSIVLEDGRVFTAPLGTPDPFPGDPTIRWSAMDYIPPAATRR